MATYPPVLISKHLTATANVVDSVTVSRSNVEVKNRGTVALFFRADGSAPTIAGDDTYVVSPGESFQISSTAAAVTVKLIAPSGCDYSVTGS